MLVFILNTDHQELALRLTEHSVRKTFADARMISVHADYADVINREIREDSSSFFITLFAGERITDLFFEELKGWLRNLPGDSAGIILPPMKQTQSIPRGPVIWRKEAILTGDNPGFLTARHLPFEHYILLEMQFRLSPTWHWNEIRTDSWKCRQNQSAKWKNTREEWDCLHPVLAAKPSAGSSSDHPLISVVICTYNNAGYLEWAIRSVLVQTFPEWELLIVDDGSQDDTARILGDVTDNPRISIFRNEVNRGKSFCLNQALSKAEGSWLVELDADDWLTPDCLAVFADKVNNMTKQGAYYADHYEWFERDNKQLIFRKRKSALSTFSPEILLDQAYPLAPRCYHVQSLKELGGWWESDPFGGRLYEDFQMLIRLSLKQPVQHIDKALYHRRLRKGSMTSSNHTCYESWKRWFHSIIELGQSLKKSESKGSD
ncbi:glycosyltransferase family 2 protein [Paenibacillus prosopidis]|uniref:Glycosyltransferase involved in cell wall biosynthesis n=1 Tax=Paenibacillus prosopidis TaxID=630520 RepID=A0A368VWA9_9BACL|nr:glycosyltransferase family A protein [Paenibacillus prosopidis]RCW46443.1 glycosyltransferase involved in cell wall biosynthesis [Paenibacillus prosopidis]